MDPGVDIIVTLYWSQRWTQNRQKKQIYQTIAV